MKTVFALILGFVAVSGTSGCCHYWGFGCCGWKSGCYDGCYDDGCYSNSYGNYSGCVNNCDGCSDNCNDRCSRKQCRRHGKKCRGRNNCCDNNDCCTDNCCDPCGGSTVTPVPAEGMPISPAYDPAMNMSTGCAGCAGGTYMNGVPMMTGMPVTSGCATGNCGAATTFDGNTGWTIMPTPMTAPGEPVQAPPAANGTPTPVSPPNNTSSVPTPVPFPTPVSSAR